MNLKIIIVLNMFKQLLKHSNLLRSSFRCLSTTSININQKSEPITLSTYVKKTSFQTSKNLAIVGVSSALSTSTFSFLSNYTSNETLFPFACVGILGAFGTSLYCAYKIDTDNIKKQLTYSNFMHIGMGVSISPSLMIYSQNIPQATILTTALVLGPATMSLYLPKDSLLKFGPALYTGLWSLIGIGIGGIFFPVLHSIDLYFGVALFTIYNMYDTHVMIKDFEEGKINHVLHACKYSLNFINIFVRILEILANMKK